MAKLSPETNNVEPSGGSTSCKYKGVRKRKWGKWVSEIRLPNSRERIWLGSYDSPEKAARAFDAALFCLRGGSASFNFPDSPPDIAGGRSLSHAEIQTAAARFANSGTTTTTAALNQVHSEDSDQSPSPTTSTPSISDWNIPMESDYLSLDAMNDSRSCWDLLTNADNINYSSNTLELDNCYPPTEYGIFPGFDDLSNNFYGPAMTTTRATFDNGDENFDGALVQEPFLWSF